MQFQCATCKDTGMISWEKPIGPLDNMVMVPMVQPCALCERGRAIWKTQTQFYVTMPNK